MNISIYHPTSSNDDTIKNDEETSSSKIITINKQIKIDSTNHSMLFTLLTDGRMCEPRQLYVSSSS